MTSKQPQIGERYRDIASAFPKTIWELFTSRNGIEHAHLISAADATDSKNISAFGYRGPETLRPRGKSKPLMPSAFRHSLRPQRSCLSP